MKIAAKNSPIPNGTLYCINVGSVMYILFALLSIDNIVFGAIKRSNPKKYRNASDAYNVYHTIFPFSGRK